MRSLTHTPGPWDRRWTHTSHSDRGTEETGEIVAPRHGIIALMVMDDTFVDANAALIAAAPELYAVAEAIHTMDCFHTGSNCPPNCPCPVGLAERALGKAKLKKV